MSGSFFQELGIPQPDINLEVGSGTQAEQAAAIMVKYERLLTSSPNVDQAEVGKCATLQPFNLGGEAMKKSKSSEAQIATALRHVDAVDPVTEMTRKLGISEAPYYIWCKKYRQMGIAEIGWLRQLENENRKVKQLVTDLTLDKVILQEVLAKKL